MLAKFSEDDRLEQMNAQRRRMKQQEHKRAVEALIDERRQLHAMDKVSYLNIPLQFHPERYFIILQYFKNILKIVIQYIEIKSTSLRFF